MITGQRVTRLTLPVTLSPMANLPMITAIPGSGTPHHIYNRGSRSRALPAFPQDNWGSRSRALPTPPQENPHKSALHTLQRSEIPQVQVKTPPQPVLSAMEIY
jgi:hypothetical protein